LIVNCQSCDTPNDLAAEAKALKAELHRNTYGAVTGKCSNCGAAIFAGNVDAPLDATPAPRS